MPFFNIFCKMILGMGKINRIIGIIVLAVIVSFGFVGNTSAACATGEQACSSSYAVGQTFFGSGGSLDSTCSTSYCAKQALGETGIGLTSSPNYQAQAGFNVNRSPYLQFIVNGATINLGVLSTTSTATATATFSVSAYLASGYSVISVSPPPQNEGYTMKALTTPTASSPGTEQFGINLVANTTACGAPADFGSNPVQEPSSAFSYGQVASGYDTCGLFQYIPNSTIAYSNKSSGVTDFTISYIENISNTTPGGTFTMNDDLVAVPTY